jgi:DNA helicase MCM8
MNAGKLPKTIECEIKDDLIDACISGDIVTICGIMKTELQNDSKGFGGGKGNKNKALHASYIDVNSIRNSNTEFFLTTPSANGDPSSVQDNKMNLAELNLIHKISERKDLFPLLISSVCPSIFGNDLVKAGLILCLFGGTDYRLKNKGDFADFMVCRDEKGGHADDEIDDEKVQPSIRPDIHLLMVGDPGLGKS